VNIKPQKQTMKTIKVVAAVVTKDGKYLCMQRCRSHDSYNSERWEFPGGKVEEDESDHEALVREIKEELDWDIYVGRKLGTIIHDYPDFTIELTAYLCKGGDGDFTMLEHLDAKWLAATELKSLKWTDADKKLVELILHDASVGTL
jgi:8-oxo-dGTP diphosphatase